MLWHFMIRNQNRMEQHNNKNQTIPSPIPNSSWLSKTKSIVASLAIALAPFTDINVQKQDTIISTTIVCDCDDNKTTLLNDINSSKAKHTLVWFSLIYKWELNLYSDDDDYIQKPCQEIWKLFYSLPIRKQKKRKKINNKKPKELAISLPDNSEDIAYQE